MAETAAIPDATKLIARARALYRQEESPENSLLIREALAEAVATATPADIEPASLAEAWGLRAHNLVCDYLNHWNDAGKDELAQAESAVQSALEIGSELPYVHYVNGFVQRARGDHQASLAAFHEALRRKPDFARAHAQLANELVSAGRPTDALAPVQEAIALGSSDLSLGAFYWIMGRAYFFAGHYRDAAKCLEKSVKLKSNVWFNRLYLVSAHRLAGNEAAAATVLNDFNALFSGYSVARVADNEMTNPNEHPVVVAGRQKFHEGLVAAGMPES